MTRVLNVRHCLYSFRLPRAQTDGWRSLQCCQSRLVSDRREPKVKSSTKPVTHVPPIEPLPAVAQKKRNDSPWTLNIAEFFVNVLRVDPMVSISARVAPQMYNMCASQAVKSKKGAGKQLAEEFWYEGCALAPSFQSWFHVTALYFWLLMVRFRALPVSSGKQYTQALVNLFFDDIEMRLREDYKMKNPRIISTTLKDLHQQFRGATAAYDEGLYRSDAVLSAAIWRNVFAGSQGVNVVYLASSTKYVRKTLFELDATSDEDISNCDFSFSRPQMDDRQPAGPDGSKMQPVRSASTDELASVAGS